MAAGLGIKRTRTETGFRVLLSLACIVIVVAGLRMAAELLIPVAMGLFLAVLSLPILKWLQHRKVPQPIAILMTVGVNLLILFALVLLASSTITEFQEKKGDYANLLKERVESFAATIDDQVERLGKFFNQSEEQTNGNEPEVDGRQPEGSPPDRSQLDRSPPDESSSEVAGTGLVVPEERQRRTFNELVTEYWDNKIILEWLGQTEVLGRLTSLASKSFFVLVIMIFVLAESGRYATKVKEVIRVRGPDLRRFQNSGRDLQKYLAIKTGASAVTGILAWLTCSVIGVDFPVLWGLVAFTFNYIPAIGSIVAAFPPIILAMIQMGFWPAMAVMVGYLAINITIGNFLEPMFLGDRFGISPLVVILSVLTWGYVWGPVGMFLAVPLTMVVKVMLDNSTDLKWISVLMGKGGEDQKSRRRAMADSAESESGAVAPEISGEEPA